MRTTMIPAARAVAKSQAGAVRRGTVLLATMLLTAVLPSHAADESKEIVVHGSKLPPERPPPRGLVGGRTPFSVTPEELLNMAQGDEAMCKQGTVRLGFEAGKFTEDGESYDVDQVIAAAKELKKAGKISCVLIDSADYDRAAFDALQTALLGPLKVSLFWPEKDGKAAKPAKAGKR